MLILEQEDCMALLHCSHPVHLHHPAAESQVKDAGQVACPGSCISLVARTKVQA